MRVRTAIAILILLAGVVAGCGGASAATGAVKRGSTGPEEEAGGLIEVEGPEPEGELVAGEEGWVRTSAGVFWTVDGGRSWRPITLPVPDGGAIGSLYFADARRGWALNEPGREGDARPSIYMTTDGGRTWRHTRLRAYDKFVMPAVEASFSLVDGHDLFALLRASGDTASSFGSLFVSRDAGRHWRALPTPPHAGRISFEPHGAAGSSGAAPAGVSGAPSTAATPGTRLNPGNRSSRGRRRSLNQAPMNRRFLNPNSTNSAGSTTRRR